MTERDERREQLGGHAEGLAHRADDAGGYPGECEVFKASLGYGHEIWLVIPATVRNEHEPEVSAAIRARTAELVEMVNDMFASSEAPD